MTDQMKSKAASSTVDDWFTPPPLTEDQMKENELEKLKEALDMPLLAREFKLKRGERNVMEVSPIRFTVLFGS